MKERMANPVNFDHTYQQETIPCERNSTESPVRLKQST
jgi:hypothetical protein